MTRILLILLAMLLSGGCDLFETDLPVTPEMTECGLDSDDCETPPEEDGGADDVAPG